MEWAFVITVSIIIVGALRLLLKVENDFSLFKRECEDTNDKIMFQFRRDLEEIAKKHVRQAKREAEALRSVREAKTDAERDAAYQRYVAVVNDYHNHS